MKFLEIAELELLSRALELSTPTLRVATRIEAYSCKAIQRERKLFKTLETDIIQDISHSTSVSPPEQHPGLLESAFGPLDKRASRKTLWLLIGLLNVAFPDHDFSKARPEDFRREESPRAVLASLSAALEHLRAPPSQRSFMAWPPIGATTSSSSPQSEGASLDAAANLNGTHPYLRNVLDPVIDLAECEVFAYTPDTDSDPHAADSDDGGSDFGQDDFAYERDDHDYGGNHLAWEMDGVGGGGGDRLSAPYHAAHLAHSGPSWQGGYGTPVKSFSPFVPPGTPTGSLPDPDEWRTRPYSSPEKSSTLLYSSHYFLFNKRMKRIVFISTCAHGRNRGAGGAFALAHDPHGLKRRASTSSLASAVVLDKKKART